MVRRCAGVRNGRIGWPAIPGPIIEVGYGNKNGRWKQPSTCRMSSPRALRPGAFVPQSSACTFFVRREILRETVF